MDEELYGYAPGLRQIAESAGVEPLKTVAIVPGVNAAHRITINYQSGRARPSVATLTQRVGEGAKLGVVYPAVFDSKPLTFTIPPVRYDAFAAALTTLRFDRLPDQPDIPAQTDAVWLIERAVVGFYKALVVAPQTAQSPYVDLIVAIQTALPEALREAH